MNRGFVICHVQQQQQLTTPLCADLTSISWLVLLRSSSYKYALLQIYWLVLSLCN